jgi:O-antigen ligase
MTEERIKKYRWAQRAVLAFVLLNTLVFGFSDLWLLVSALLGAIMLLRDPSYWRNALPPGTFWVAMAFAWVFMVKLVSALWAIDPTKAIDNAFNHTHFLLWPLVLPILSRSGLNPFAAERWLCLSFVGLLIFYVIVLWIWPESEQGDRFGGGWGSYGMLANVLVFYLLWVFAALTRPGTQKTGIQTGLLSLAMLAGLWVLLATKGRAEQLILAAGLLAILIFRLRSSLSWLRSLTIVLIGAFALSVFVGVNADRFSDVLPEVKTYLQGGEARQASVGTSMGGRMEMYRMAMEAIADRPWLGWGAGLRPNHVPQYATDPSNPLHYSNFHNFYLQIPLEIGILGSLGTLAVVFLILRLTLLKTMRHGDSEIALLIAVLWGVYAFKSLLNATFGYSLPNGVFVFFTAWFWLHSIPAVKSVAKYS